MGRFDTWSVSAGRSRARDQPPGKIRLLLVEDDAVDRMAFERMVGRRDLGYDLSLAKSLAHARELLDTKGPFDIVLTDYYLGDGCGLELIEHLMDTPLVVITGAGDEAIAIEAMRAGAYDYLVKDNHQRYLELVPVTVDSALHHHVSTRRAGLLQEAVTQINEGVYITGLDGRITFVNEAFRRIYGYGFDGGDDSGSGSGKVSPDVVEQQEEVLWSDVGEQDLMPCRPFGISRAGERGECVHRRADGTRLAVLLSRSVIVDGHDRVIAGVGTVRDISERKLWELALRESEERYALAAAGANDGLWDWDLRSEEVYFSDRWKSLLGYDSGDVGNDLEAWLALVHPEDGPLLAAQLNAHIAGRTPHFENEHRIRARNGEYLWVHVRGLAVRDGDGQTYRMSGSLRDITDRKLVEQQLTHAALHDELTGLPNRALFLDRLERALDRLRRHQEDYAFAVIFLDLDRFKVINESLGHLAGDEVLKSIGSRLGECLRLGDTVARLGGDEFAVLLDELDHPGRADTVAERMHEALEAPFQVHGHEVFTSASIGVTLSSTGYERPEDVLRDADTAMYRAKAEGRTRKVVFDPGMHETAVALLHLENDLRRAIEGRDFQLYYQPIVALEDGRLEGFEALIRWPHGERGLVPPDEFLPLAREMGVATRIGWWVLREACRQLQSWRKTCPKADALTVSVNLEGEQLSSPELIERVEESLKASGLPSDRLKLEITEGMIIANPDLASRTLEHLRQNGVGLYIDDFGTGYSSLSQLHRFPVDALKIDRSFVGRIGNGGDELEIVRTIILLASNLGMEAVAEGVEDSLQWDCLRSLGCQHAQGYLFAKPLPADEVEGLLASLPGALPGFPIDESESTANLRRPVF